MTKQKKKLLTFLETSRFPFSFFLSLSLSLSLFLPFLKLPPRPFKLVICIAKDGILLAVAQRWKVNIVVGIGCTQNHQRQLILTEDNKRKHFQLFWQQMFNSTSIMNSFDSKKMLLLALQYKRQRPWRCRSNSFQLHKSNLEKKKRNWDSLSFVSRHST